MRAQDIVLQLSRFLPTFADDFTDQATVTSITQAAGTATVNTDGAHGLSVGKQVIITGALTPISITSINRVGAVATMITATDHDMTENAGFDVQISGATEAEFNGTFVLLAVPNRRTIRFTVADSGATSATGTPLLLNGSNIFADYNGLAEVLTVPSANSFQYAVSPTLFSPAHGSIDVKTNPRISSSVSYGRIVDAYTKQPQDKAWLFVVMGDALANKSRDIDIDSTDNIQAGHYFNQRLIQSVQLFLFYPTQSEISGRAARDRAEELLRPICRSMLGYKFPSLVENSNNPLMVTGHGFEDYTTAFYVHQYAFEATLQLGPTDVFVPDVDVAFRDIDMTIDVRKTTKGS